MRGGKLPAARRARRAHLGAEGRVLVQHTDAPRKLVGHSVAALHQHGLAAGQILRHTAAAGRQHGASAGHRLHGHKARGLLHQRGHAAQVGQAVVVGQVLIGDVARELYAVAQTLGLLLQFALERALLGAGEEGAAHDQQLDVRLMQRGNGLHQLMDALVRVEPPTVEHDEILVGKAELRAQLGFTDEDFVVLYCGRLDPDKGIHKLMEAIAALHEPHIKLLIVGSPFFARTQQSAFQRKLEQQAKSLGNRVQFTGYIPNEDLPDYYRLADLCCVPTLVEEAAGLVAVEAMACGRPVLATRSGGMPEYLAGSQAVLVERGDTVTDQLAWSIRMLYEHPALCTEMGAAGAARGREFSTAHYYEEFVRIVRDVTENGGAQ